MAYTSNNYNSVNTAGLQFYNNTKGFESTVKLGHWNGCVTISIHPMLPDNKITEKNKWDYDISYNVAITAERAHDLKEAVEDILEQIQSGNYDFASRGVPTSNNFVEIAPVTKIGLVEEGVCLTIFNKLNNGIPEAYKSFIFNKSSYFENFNHETGEYQKGRPLETQFKLFYITLCEAIKVATKAYTHSMRLGLDYQNKMVRDSLVKLREKAGIEPYNPNANSGRNNNGNNFFGNGGGNANTGNATNLYNSAMNNTSYSTSNIENGGIIGGERLSLED